jgi:hypothetical protein
MSRRVGPALLFGLAALCLWHGALRAHGRGIPLTTDEGEYSVAADAWKNGGLPYRDAYIQKPPTVVALYLAAPAPRVAAGIAGIGALLLIAACVPSLWSVAARAAAAASFSALGALPLGDFGFTACTEVFVNLFAAMSALFVLSGEPFYAGLLAGVALSAKQTALWTLLGFGAVAAWRGRRLDAKMALRFLEGAAIAPAFWFLYFAARGGLGDYLEAAWSGNLRYASAIVMTGAAQDQLRWFLRTLGPKLLLGFLPALALGGYALRGRKAGPDRPVETLAVVWFGTAFAGALTGLYLFPHYFLTLAPAAALAAACGVERLEKKFRWPAVATLALWPVIAFPSSLFLGSARSREISLLYPNPVFETQVLGGEISRRAKPGDSLHVFGSEGALYVYAGLKPATRYTQSYALTLFPADDAAWKKVMTGLEAVPPRFMVWSGQPLSTMIAAKAGLAYRDALKAFIEKGYTFAGSVRVTDSPEIPKLEPAAKKEKPPFDAEDRLLLFERQ